MTTTATVQLFVTCLVDSFFPEVGEAIVREMEASIYNIGIANQNGDHNINYFALLDGQKTNYDSLVHCCCGVGTRMYGSLPEYIYTIGHDTLSVDLFAASTFAWERDAGVVRVIMDTQMPYDGRVSLGFECVPQEFTLRVRIPRWVKGAVEVKLNGAAVGSGVPGSYVNVQARWKSGDTVMLDLPFAWKLTRYEGVEQVDGDDRYAYEYGPLLMAFQGKLDEKKHIVIEQDAARLPTVVRPNGRPLHFAIPGQAGLELVPYLEIKPGMTFTCFPLFRKEGSPVSDASSDRLPPGR